MAVPSFTNGSAYSQDSGSASHNINLPAGTAFKGVLIFTLSSGSHTVDEPAGWSLLASVALDLSRRLSLLASDAPISDTSITVSASAFTEAAAFGFSTDGDLPNAVIPTWVTGSGTTPDPPDLSGMASGDYRVVVVEGTGDARRNVSAFPTDYSDNQAQTKAGTVNGNPTIGLASRGLTSITAEAPGTFTLTGAPAWGAGTFAIPPLVGSSFEGEIDAGFDPVGADLAGSFDDGVIEGVIDAEFGSVGADLAASYDGPSYPGGLPPAAVIAIFDARHLAGSPTDPVINWPDEGPLGQDPLTQGTSGNRPQIDDSGFGGVRSVLFDGTNDRLDMSLAASYTEDFALILVCELLTYPTGTAAVFYSTGSIPNKNILGVDDAEDPPGWVVMSGEDGTQAQHHHGTANQTYLEAVPSRFIMTQLIRNDGELKLWENTALVIDLADASGEGTDLNNLVGLKVGAREDNSRFVNGRIAYIILVDMTETDEVTLLDARDEIAPLFNVPGFGEVFEGEIDSILGVVSAALAGTVEPPEFSGAIGAALVEVAGDLAGTVELPEFSGEIDSTLGAVTADLTGTTEPPEFSGEIDSTLGAVAADLAGMTEPPEFSGEIDAGLGIVTGALAGTAELPEFDGTIDTALGEVQADLTGTRELPEGAGTINGLFESVTADLAGSFHTVHTGSIAPTLGTVTADLVGAAEPPEFSGEIAADLSNVVVDIEGTRELPEGAGTINGVFGPVVGDLAGAASPPDRTGTIETLLGAVAADLVGGVQTPTFGTIDAGFGPVLADIVVDVTNIGPWVVRDPIVGIREPWAVKAPIQ